MTQKVSLYELNNRVKGVINETLPELVWVIAEINEINTNKSGHCYLELIEKDATADRIIAKARATIFAFTNRLLKPYFETTTGQAFSSGIKVLLHVKVEFHELFGYSLNVQDIDPTYTIGDLARQKMQTIKKLKKEGIFYMNMELQLPLLPANIAVISSKTAAGFQDFIHQLKNNPYGYTFNTKLFSSLVQGKDAEVSIIRALERIFQYEDFFDAVVIIRGGGSQTDLNCFNNYLLSSYIAQFPLPIITGIGHEKDETVADLVAAINLKTPTAVAEFLIQSFLDFENNINDIQENIADHLLASLSEYNDNLSTIGQNITPIIHHIIGNKVRRLDQVGILISSGIKNYLNIQMGKLESTRFEIQFKMKDNFKLLTYQLKGLFGSIKILTNQFNRSQSNKLDIHQQSLRLLDPGNILKRGYSITYTENKLVTRVSNLKKEDILNTKFSDGEVFSKVKNVILDQSEKEEKKQQLKTK